MNKEKLLKLAQRLEIIKHPKHYNQDTWLTQNECGTTACLAGHAVLMEGAKPRFEILAGLETRFERARGKEFLSKRTERTRKEAGYVQLGGHLRSIRIAAREALELTPWEADRLFDEGGTGWPDPFALEFQRADPHGKIQVAVRLLRGLANGTVWLDRDEDDQED